MHLLLPKFILNPSQSSWSFVGSSGLHMSVFCPKPSLTILMYFNVFKWYTICQLHVCGQQYKSYWQAWCWFVWVSSQLNITGDENRIWLMEMTLKNLENPLKKPQKNLEKLLWIFTGHAIVILFLLWWKENLVNGHSEKCCM